MRVDLVQYFVMATLGHSISTVFYGHQPSDPDNCTTVYAEPEEVNVHSTVELASYQAIIRHETYATGETWARTIFDAIKEKNSLNTYHGLYLTAAMSGTTDPITFAPDDGSGNTKAAVFTVADYILIGEEMLKVTGVSSPNVTASRAALGSTKAAHLENAEIYNCTQNPIPGKQCDSTFPTEELSGVLPLGFNEDNDTWEFSVNWTVTLIP